MCDAESCMHTFGPSTWWKGIDDTHGGINPEPPIIKMAMQKNIDEATKGLERTPGHWLVDLHEVLSDMNESVGTRRSG